MFFVIVVVEVGIFVFIVGYDLVLYCFGVWYGIGYVVNNMFFVSGIVSYGDGVLSVCGWLFVNKVNGGWGIVWVGY